MSLSMVLLAVVVALAVGGWLMFGAKAEPTDGAEPSVPEPTSFRCKLCGASSATFLAAHEHASADHELTGHKIDESIEAK